MTIDEFIFHLQNPQIYTGRELNSIRKEPTDPGRSVTICLVFPDRYEIGMSHYGLALLYHLLNGMENVSAERCFLPPRESVELFKTHNVPLFSLENKRPLSEFDIVSFSLLSEMNFTNVLQVLDLAGIPLHSRDRDGAAPVIAAGGISAINPEPLRDFIDVFGIGDGEVLFPDLTTAVLAAKADHPPGKGTRQDTLRRRDLLERLDRTPGFYVPARHPVVKNGRFLAPDLAHGSIKKRTAKTLSAAPPGGRTIVPVTNVVFNRLNVEIARGCPHNCRFCQARSYYSPYRCVAAPENLRQIEQGLKETGFDTFSLSTLSAGDYPYLEELLTLIPRVIAAAPGVHFSFSSLRPSTLSKNLLATLARFKRTGITIVPEAGTDRLRRVINKDVTDAEIFQAVELAMRGKWQKIKLYFMLGLPTETMEDIDGIVCLIRRIMDVFRSERQKINVHASFSSFVPKPHTPLQWAKRDGVEDFFAKSDHIRQSLKNFNHRVLHLDFHPPHNGVVETILTRGDSRVGNLLLAAFRKGEIFSAWDGEFHYPVWKALIAETGCEEFLEAYPIDGPLPWDFLQVNFKKEHLQEQYGKALAAEPTPRCTPQRCKECRGCLYPMPTPPSIPQSTAQATGEQPTHEPEGTPEEERQFRKIRLFYEKSGDFIFFSQLGMLKYVERLIRQAGIFFKCSQGFTPRIKMASLPPLPVFATGLQEVVELFVDASLEEKDLLARLNPVSESRDFRFTGVMDCTGRPNLSRDIRYLHFEIVVEKDRDYAGELADQLVDSDRLSVVDDRLRLDLDYSQQGQERFARLYKIIDPQRRRTLYLTRTAVTFKDAP